jgi:hypothetical protein
MVDREKANLELRLIVSFEDDTKSEDDQKRKKEVPTECRTVSEKFTISGIKNGPQSLEPHTSSRSFPQASPGQL